MMKIMVFLCLLGVLLLCSCAIGKKTLALKDTLNLEIRKLDGKPYLKMSGLVLHSALAAKEIHIERNGNILSIKIELGRAKKGMTGNFEYVFPIPEDVKVAVFGEEQKQVWSRATSERQQGPQMQEQ
jgi:hypothetical protein